MTMFSLRMRRERGSHAHQRKPMAFCLPAFLASRTNVLSSLSTSLTASCVVASQVLPRNGSLTRTTGPAWRSRVRVGNGSRMNDCEARSIFRMSAATSRALQPCLVTLEHPPAADQGRLVVGQVLHPR